MTALFLCIFMTDLFAIILVNEMKKRLCLREQTQKTNRIPYSSGIFHDVT